MLDNDTNVIYGWKLTGDKVNEIQEKLETVCDEVYHKDMCDILDGFIIEDTMCGNYFYFGALLVSYDANEDEEGEIIDTKLVNKVTKKYNDMLKKYPEISKIFEKYNKKEPKLYVMQHIW